MIIASTTLALSAFLAPMAEAPPQAPAEVVVHCPTEDTNNGDLGTEIETPCVWLADQRGNGEGVSYIAWPDGSWMELEYLKMFIKDTRSEVRQHRRHLRNAETPRRRRCVASCVGNSAPLATTWQNSGRFAPP